MSSTEQDVLNEILQVHAPSRSTEALETVASASRKAIGGDEASARPALGYPIIAPRFISNYLANAGLPETPENRQLHWRLPPQTGFLTGVAQFVATGNHKDFHSNIAFSMRAGRGETERCFATETHRPWSGFTACFQCCRNHSEIGRYP